VNVNELFQQLSERELSSLSMALEGQGSIREAEHPKIIGYANDAMKALYSRFILKEDQVVIECIPERTMYPLKSQYAVNGGVAESESNPHFIIDTEDKPFTEDVIKLLKAYEVDYGEIPINDTDHSHSVFTPFITTVQVPSPDGKTIAFIYQAKPELISVSELATDIQVPFVLEDALRTFVAHRVFQHMGGKENAVRSGEFLGQYESICEEIKQADLVYSSISSTGLKFTDRGFV
jgi:hypothetical protein